MVLTEDDVKILSGLGFENAARCGRMVDYMTMMNMSGSGGYKDHHFDHARASDQEVAAGRRPWLKIGVKEALRP